MDSGSLQTAIAGTAVLWAVSASLAVALALVLATASGASRRSLRVAARIAVNVSRGVPTSLYVIAAGLVALRAGGGTSLPAPFPGTAPGFQMVAWAIALALAVGSAGHLAEIFAAAHRSLGSARLEEARALGLAPARRLALLGHEAAPVVLPPTSARLVHHLHNTAFAALFPVVEVFGHVEGQANASFDVSRAVLTGCTVYVVLSALIWAGFRAAEAGLTPPLTGRSPRR